MSNNKTLQYRVAVVIGLAVGLAVALYSQQRTQPVSNHVLAQPNSQMLNNAASAAASTNSSTRHIAAANSDTSALTPNTSKPENDAIQAAFQAQRSNVWVQGGGMVQKVLADDNEGSRHQKFILELSNGLTVLVAHNIDLAPRLYPLQQGDAVQFYGEYEYSPQGGVIHWTHRDPQGRRQGGWLASSGQRVE